MRTGCKKIFLNGIQLSNSENTLFDTKILKISLIKASVTFCCYGNKNSLATKLVWL